MLLFIWITASFSVIGVLPLAANTCNGVADDLVPTCIRRLEMFQNRLFDPHSFREKFSFFVLVILKQ